MPEQELRIGCCGFQKSQSLYYQHFETIEIQQTFYRLPQIKTAQRWRIQAAPGFIFTLKALQLITHEPTSPTYQRSGMNIPPSERGNYGFFRPTPEVFDAWDRTLEIANELQATLVVFQCPPQFTPTRSHVDHMNAFFQAVSRGGMIFAWEPRGNWPDELVAELCRDLDLIHCVDPFLNATQTNEMAYFRMHGGKDYSHQFSDEELNHLQGLIQDFDHVYCMFNNVHMWEDALRFKEMNGQSPYLFPAPESPSQSQDSF